MASNVSVGKCETSLSFYSFVGNFFSAQRPLLWGFIYPWSPIINKNISWYILEWFTRFFYGVNSSIISGNFFLTPMNMLSLPCQWHQLYLRWDICLYLSHVIFSSTTKIIFLFSLWLQQLLQALLEHIHFYIITPLRD